jgi:formylglycine-generating enzyme required for sulfatase activity
MPSSSVMKKGQSGYMSIPTESSHNGWLNSVILKVDSVEFTMIPVEYSEGNFLLAETELTRELYNAIIGAVYNSGLQFPAFQTYSKYETFLSKLNVITGLNFRFPTYDEWKYAAKGGNKSQSYTYSGSNVISDVAWYSGNSNNSMHDVKQLQPNELGFYDMSGNADEFILYKSYLSTSSYNFTKGGSYTSSESDCQTGSISTISSSSMTAGLRIALSNTNK